MWLFRFGLEFNQNYAFVYSEFNIDIGRRCEHKSLKDFMG